MEKQNKNNVGKEIASVMARLVDNILMNTLAQEYYLLGLLNTHDEIPIELFEKQLKLDKITVPRARDYEGFHINENMCVSDSDFAASSLNYFLFFIDLSFASCVTKKTKQDENGNFIFNDKITAFKNTLYPIFVKVLKTPIKYDGFLSLQYPIHSHNLKIAFENLVADVVNKKVKKGSNISKYFPQNILGKDALPPILKNICVENGNKLLYNCDDCFSPDFLCFFFSTFSFETLDNYALFMKKVETLKLANDLK